MPTERMEFKSHLCVALLVMLCCACYHVSSQHTENTNCNQSVDESKKMMEMLWRQLQDTASILTDTNTLIMLQTQHNRDVTKDISDLQIQFSSAMAAMTEALTSVNSQVSSLAQQQQEKKKTITGGCTGNITGLTTIFVHSQPITVPCDGQGWIVIQRRVDRLHDFPNKDWQDYKRGFGSLSGSFWLGLEHMHRLTNDQEAMLRVELEDWEGETRYAYYSYVRVEGEKHKYRLYVDGYSGTAGDTLQYNTGMMFTTQDSDNDVYSANNCADLRSGGWWYNRCGSSLNGEYVSGGACEYGRGITWEEWKGIYYSYKKIQMKLFIQ